MKEYMARGVTLPEAYHEALAKVMRLKGRVEK